MKEPISIIIAAYQTQDYIEECLDSIENQTYFNNNKNYEILVGVDGCQETLNKLIKIRNKYNNLKIIKMLSNKGSYITLNTLLSLVKFDNIIKFDSDDIMLSNLIEEIMNINGDLIRFMYYKYNEKNNEKRKCDDYANGCYYINKKVYNILNGYQPWRFSADTEFLLRFKQLNLFKEVKINKPLFYYRQHNHSLTKTVPIHQRVLYHNKFKNKKLNINITSVVNDFEVI
ncbi:MAG: glycosyltransferase family 2 protein [bacterium]